MQTCTLDEQMGGVSLQSPGFYRRLFIVPKSTGGWRPVLGLSPLNAFLRKIPFRMETPVSVREAVREGDWATSINLSDAYFLILMHQIDRRCSTALQRGNFPVLSSTLRPLTGCMGLHSNRERAVLPPALQGCTPESLSQRLDPLTKLQAIVRERDVTDRLGFLVNYRSRSFPSPSPFLSQDGLQHSLVHCTPVTASRSQAPGSSSCLLKKRVASARTLTSLLGMMESLAPLLPLGRLHKQEFQHQFHVHWVQSGKHWDTQILLVPWLLLSTTHWLDSE